MDKFCEDCVHNEVCQYGAIPPHIDRCNDKDTIDDIRPKGEWIMIKNSDGNLKCYECSACGKCQGYISNYCEDCGADMQKGGAE